eukprot:1324774-Amphidinium_carterae.3
MNALPDGPSRDAYQKYRTLLHEWEAVVENLRFQKGHRDLGAPPLSREWNEKAVRQGFKSETGLTPNMFEWIIESAVTEAIEKPHPSKNFVETETKDQFGRTIKAGQFNMLFNYTSGEEYGYQVAHFWFEKNQ